MPKPSQYSLVRSHASQHYELHAQGQPIQCFREGDGATFSRWLDAHTSFAFVGQNGRLSMLKEARARGSDYWYAYQKQGRQTRKRYLGRSNQVTFARLEETAQALARASTLSEPPASPTQPPAGQSLLLSSKLALPPLPHTLVERERLLVELDGAFSTPLTLLAASAGWGKTTLLSAWANRHPAQVAWLSLDELDTSPTRFWVSLIAALRRCGRLGPRLGETAVTLLQSPQPPPLAACLATLLHELDSHEALPAPLVLILDDYHLVTDPALHESLSFFLEHLPAHLHLILSSRVDPDLPLSRHRVRGQLTEIRADDLRFRLEEANHFLGQMLSPPLSEEEVQRLVNRTEGWIAGLHLTALTLQKREDRAAFLQALTGSQRYLLDYVQEEILARLPESVRDFLLHTSILSRLDAEACQAVTAEPKRVASQKILEWLERANLFLVSLDEERRCYRLHELFREALLAALDASQPELVPLLHRRAASFYVAQEQWHEAITHALEGRDYSTAARLMEQTVEQFWVHGEAATMVNWLLGLPEPVVRENARLALTTALYLLHPITYSTREQRESRHRQVRQLMARVEMALRRASDEIDQENSATQAGTGAVSLPEDRKARATEDALLHRRLRLLRTGMALYEVIATSEYERLPTLHQEMQELDQDEEVIWHMLPLFCSVTLYYAVRQEGAKLLPQLLDAKQRVRRSESHFAAIRVMQWLALSALAGGRLRLATQESQAALDLIEQMSGFALLKGYFQLILAEVWYQWNRLEEARSLLLTVIQDAATWQHSDLLLLGYIRLMQVELARGDLSAVQQALQEFEKLEGFQGYHHWRWLPIIRAQWWLAQGQLREASDWAANVVFPQGAWEGSMYDAIPVVVQVHFAQHRWREALELLDRFKEHLDRPANIRITLTYLTHYLVALQQTGNSEQAAHVAARLFAITEPEGHLRVYLDAGTPMRQALSTLLAGAHPGKDEASAEDESCSATVAIARPYVLRLLAAFEQEEQNKKNALHHSLSKIPHASSVRGRVASASPALVEPLTKREQEVLHLLAAGASNQQIAAALVIQLSTVKKHVSNLLSKLGAESRTQAIAQARAFSLL